MNLAVGESERSLVNLDRVNRSGTESSFKVSSFSQPEERRTQTASYLNSLIEKLYPKDIDTEGQKNIKAEFAAYLNGDVERESENKNPGDISAKRLQRYLCDLHLARLDAEAIEAGLRQDALPFAEDQPQKIEGSLDAFLESKEVIPYFSRQVGEGNFGIVVNAGVKGVDGKYVYKKEKRDFAKALTACCLISFDTRGGKIK